VNHTLGCVKVVALLNASALMRGLNTLLEPSAETYTDNGSSKEVGTAT
jgi:hypothetical protein